MSEFVIDRILPTEQLHLVAGASGVGKTSWMFPTIVDWKGGKRVFGYESFPAPYVYISCDRSRKSINATVSRLGLDPKDFDGPDGRGRNIETIVTLSKQHCKDVKVIFIDGFQSLLKATEGSKLYAETSDFLVKASLTAEREHVTLIGTCHTPKMKEHEGYPDLRQRVSGSAAWAAYTETIILIERMKADDVYDNRRILYVLPRNAKEERFDFQVDDNGRFVEVTCETAFFLLYDYLKRLPFDEILSGQAFADFSVEKSISRRTLFRWFTDAIENAWLERLERGSYRRRRRA